MEERANELREEFEIIQMILDKPVRNLSNSEIDILVKICTGNTRSVPIISHPRPPPQPQPILTHSTHQSAPPYCDFLSRVTGCKKTCMKYGKKSE